MLTRKDMPAFLAALETVEDKRVRTLIAVTLLTGIEQEKLVEVQQLDLDPSARSIKILLRRGDTCDGCGTELEPAKFATVPLSIQAWTALCAAIGSDPRIFGDGKTWVRGREFIDLSGGLERINAECGLAASADDLRWMFSAVALQLGYDWSTINALSDAEPDDVTESTQHRRQRLKRLRRVSQRISNAFFELGLPCGGL